jgi:hypothetical protein
MPMKVLIVEPGKYPREADIEHTLEAEQAVVGGTIEAVYPWRDSACIVCNDNGIAENLPLNRMLGDYDIIHGTFFVCGLTSNDFTDLTPQQMKRYEELYHDPQLFFLLGKTLGVEALALQPEEVVVIGDSYRKDIQPAQSLGCDTIWIKGAGWDDSEAAVQHDKIITDIAQLQELL